MMKMFVLGLMAALECSARPRLGKCYDEYKPMQDFEVERYLGTWYDIHHDKFTPFQILKGCVIAEYS